MEYSRMFSAVLGNFRKKRKKFLTDPIHYYVEDKIVESIVLLNSCVLIKIEIET